jgi:hypothetical protein
MSGIRAFGLWLLTAVGRVLVGLSWFITHVFGVVEWKPPAWFAEVGPALAAPWRAIGRYFKGDPIRAGITALAVIVALGGWFLYLTLPKPHYIEYTIAAPTLTRYGDNGIASISPVTIDFMASVAPLQQVQKKVAKGITLSPNFAGTWVWVTDRQLQFTPKGDWPVDATFTVQFAHNGFFARGVELEDYSADFKSPPFAAAISSAEFYQDPRDPNLKKLVATVTFTHPVDSDQFERRVSLVMAQDAAYLGLKPDSRNLTLAYDKYKLAAHIHSAALAMPRDDTRITLRIDKGVRAARGGNETKARLESTVSIPGRASLRFSGAQMTLVDNARYEPEQVLLLSSSSPVERKALEGKVSVYLLPVRHPKQAKEDKEPYAWEEEHVGSDILAKSQRLNLTYVASDEPGNTSHGFKFLAPVGRYLYVLVPDGVQGVGGYFSGKPYAATLVVEPYKQALTFLGQGALLSLSGDKKIGYLTRDVENVEVQIGRVLPEQLHHIAPMMYDYSHPNLDDDLEDRVVERFTAVRDYSGKQPGKPTYDSVDLGQYLQGRTQANRGLFLVRIRSVKKPKKDEAPQENEQDFGGIADTRLVLLTDLGFIVKQAKDGSRDVFVQSIRTGLPVDGASIQAIGRNGQPVMSAMSDGAGRAKLAKFPELKREKAPLMILAQKDGDLSFMPFRTQGRTLDMSRFDTGGVENAKSESQLSAYLFTDRGIYRPGETTHLGLITRTADWKSSLTGLPLDIEISDSRGNVVSRNAIKLSPSAFDETAFSTQTSAPTGTYQAVAYLAKDPEHRETLGSTSFKVQEFEPDRMKVRLDLTDRPVDGWLRPADVKTRVTVAQLFGEPAGNRRVEGEMSLTAVLPRFARYADYRFQIGEFLNEPFHEDLAPTVTDDKGNAEFNIDLGRFTGRAYRLNVLVRAFEAQGGRNVAAQNSAIVSDAPFLVGVKADGELSFVSRGSTRQAHWLAVNQQLAPVAAEGLTLDWVQRKYVSVLTQQEDRTYRYVSRLKEVVRDSRKVRIAAGGSNFALPTSEPGDFVLVLRDASGAELNKLSYSVAGEANLSRSLDRNAELQVQLDKSSYLGGDTIEVSIRAPYVGAGLITIERDRVYQHQWFKTSTTSSVQRIQLPKDFEGNGYVSVQFVRDPASDEIFLSPLSYGVAAFSANLAVRTEPLRLTAPREIRPGSTLVMRIVPGEASRIGVLAVDEGILQVARYHNPDPLAYFFQKRMLEVDTTQILDLILPEFKRFMAIAAPGGDADSGFARHLNPFAKKRKPPVAYWSGLMDVGPEGRELRYLVPDYFNGKVRIVAIAVSPQRVGVAESATEVKGSFILTPNVPSMVAPGDEFVVSVGVFNNTVGAKGPIRVDAQVSRELASQGSSSVELQVADKKEGAAEFRFKANEILGAATLKFTARRGAAESHLEESVSVRPLVAYRTQLSIGRFTNSRAAVPLTRDVYSEKRQVQAAESMLPLVWGSGLTAWLDAYPYPCTEQLVSKGMAALLLASRPEFGAAKSSDPQPLASTYAMLQARENDKGGFGLWSSSPQTAEFPTIYAAHFLVEAKERGQKIPAPMMSSVNDWLAQFATTPASTLDGGRLRAYAVYLLARQGIKANAALSNVEQELSNRYAKTWPSDLAAAYLASTYRLMQRNGDAERIVGKIPWADERHDWGQWFYYDGLVHDSQLLYLLAKHFPKRLSALPPSVLEGIGRSVSGNRQSSLSAAYTLLALDAYASVAGASGKLGISELGKDGREKVLPLPAGAMPKVNVSEAAAKVQFGKEGPLPAYYLLNESGFDRGVPPAEINRGIEIIHEFLDMKDTVITQAKVGQEFLVRLRLRATERDRLPQLALVDLLPGGVEAVLELRPQADSSAPGVDPIASTGVSALPIGLPEKSTWYPEHVDVRDDRLVLYGEVDRDAKTFVYRVRATNAGVFQAPPAFVEGMYDRTITGRGMASRLEIVKP